MKNLKLFAQIAKIDESRHEVWGVATAEVVDKEGEIFDYESSKPYFQSWSDEIAKATDGKSLGNVREMHAPSAVGKLVAIDFDDELRQIRVGARIVDSTAWQKCAQGVYTGFSIGGSYVKTWNDGECVRFTANPVEISVVDNPCVPGAHFTAVKSDGTTEIRKFKREAAALIKIGARHSKETLAHLAAIDDCMSKMAACQQEAASHLSALLNSDDSSNSDRTHADRAYDDRTGDDQASFAAVQIRKSSDPSGPQIKMGEQTMQDATAKDKEQMERSASAVAALSKLAEVEKSVTALRREMESNNQEIQKSLTNLLQLLEKLLAPEQSSPAHSGARDGVAARVSRSAVPSVTVRKEDDVRPADKSADSEPSVHDLLKHALQHPQRAANYLR